MRVTKTSGNINDYTGVDYKLKKQIKSGDAERSQLYGSLLLFTQVFYKLRTGKEFQLSYPQCRESHFISICRELTRVMRGELDLLVINIAPRYGKTELLIHFVAWCMAKYPDCNFLYTSYTHNLASTQSATIRDILMLPEYRQLFFVEIKQSSKAKFDFKTTESGGVYAAGLDGTILGRGAGIKGVDRFGGAIIIDDAHKEAEVHSDVTRQSVIDRYEGTLLSRRNDGFRTPIIFIGQCLHEADLASHLKQEIKDDTTGRKKLLSLSSLDEAKNALYPEIHTKEQLLEMQEKNPYVFAAQHQQNPQPAGGGLYKEDDFKLLDVEPAILTTFITCDTAETEKNYNNASVFSHWGLYKIKQGEFDTGLYGLHWLNCWELRVEPKHLYNEFMQFYYTCMQHPIKPTLAAIEKKSTGTTLGSSLEDIQGLQIIKIERSRASGSKTDRFISIQRYIATKRVSLTRNAKHTQMCIDHCAKITANNTHRFDDICDTLYDAVKLALIDKSFVNIVINETTQKSNKVIEDLARLHQHRKKLRRASIW